MGTTMDTQWEGTMEEWAAGGFAGPSAPAEAPAVTAAPLEAVADTERPAEAAPATALAAPRIEAPTPEARRYLDILEKRIAEGTGRTARVIELVGTQVPFDQVAPLTAVRWAPTTSSRGLAAQVGDHLLTPSDHALGQIAERAGVPAAYVRSLLSSREGDGTGPGWQRELAAEIL